MLLKQIIYFFLCFVCFSQSSFARNKYKFTVYMTGDRRIDDSQIPDDEANSNDVLMDSEDVVTGTENRRKVN